MILCAAGDIHGRLDQMYTGVLAFEEALAVRFDFVLHVGDFGNWPDPNRVDGATKRHDGAGDFPSWIAERRAAPGLRVVLSLRQMAELQSALLHRRRGRALGLHDA